VSRTAVENGLRFVVRVDPEPFRRRAPWEEEAGEPPAG
jgi:hypothetical protein